MTSLFLLTLDRFDITKRCVHNTLLNAGTAQYELLICDNGSQDQRIISYAHNVWEPDVHILNKENRGIAPMHNQMLTMAKGDFFCLIGNDIELPPGWLDELVETYKKIPNAGMAGVHCVQDLFPVQNINGVDVRPGWNIFGTMFWSREVFNKIGYFNPAYAPYGLDDSDYHYRLNKSGYINFYLKDARSTHVAEDVGEKSEYRKMKDESQGKNLEIFSQAIKKYDETKNYYTSIQDAFTTH